MWFFLVLQINRFLNVIEYHFENHQVLDACDISLAYHHLFRSRSARSPKKNTNTYLLLRVNTLKTLYWKRWRQWRLTLWKPLCMKVSPPGDTCWSSSRPLRILSLIRHARYRSLHSLNAATWRLQWDAELVRRDYWSFDLWMHLCRIKIIVDSLTPEKYQREEIFVQDSNAIKARASKIF